MAYVNQEKKQKIAEALKIKLAKYNVKYSLKVRNNSTIVMTVKSGDIDFFTAFNAQLPDDRKITDDHFNVNKYHYQNHVDGVAKQFLDDAFECLNIDNFDHSDIMTDYFAVGHYVDVRIGAYAKPYNLATIEKKEQMNKELELKIETIGEIKKLMKLYGITKQDLV